MLILPPSIQPSSRKPVRKHSTRAFPSGVEAPPIKAARTLVPIGCGQLSNGQAAAPPTSVMKSRRLTGCPFSRRRYSTMLRAASRQILTADVRYGSKADILGALRTSFVCVWPLPLLGRELLRPIHLRSDHEDFWPTTNQHLVTICGRIGEQIREPERRLLRHQPNCIKPQIAIRAETTRAAHDTFIDTLYGPTATVHRLASLTTCPTATRAKIRAETTA